MPPTDSHAHREGAVPKGAALVVSFGEKKQQEGCFSFPDRHGKRLSGKFSFF